MEFTPEGGYLKEPQQQTNGEKEHKLEKIFKLHTFEVMHSTIKSVILLRLNTKHEPDDSLLVTYGGMEGMSSSFSKKLLYITFKYFGKTAYVALICCYSKMFI